MDITQIQEIVRIPEITTIPNAPHFVEGIVNLRGEIVPLVDLKKMFGLPTGERNEENRIIIVNIGDKTNGVLVDRVQEVLRLDEEQIEPAPEFEGGTVQIDNRFLTGIGKMDQRILLLLDLGEMLKAV